jgi:hypothetical protein
MFSSATKVLRAVVLAIASCSLLLAGCLPPSTLSSWPGYPTLQQNTAVRNWLILKCAFSDDPGARVIPGGLNAGLPDLDTYIDKFFTIGGVGTGNLVDYYRDLTYGLITFNGTRVYGWYTAPYASNSNLDRTTRVQQCATAAVTRSSTNPNPLSVDFSQYWGIIIVTNKPQDSGECFGPPYGRQNMSINGQTYSLACVVMDSAGMWTSWAGHEIGHGLGLAHSSDNTACTSGYCDQFDVMSTCNDWQFYWSNYPPEGAEGGRNGRGICYGGAGPGLNVPNLLTLNALPQDRIVTYHVGDERLMVTLTALSHPAGSLPLAIKIYDQSANDYYTVEYRQADGWDQGMGGDQVLIHEFKPGQYPYSFLQEGPYVVKPGTSGGYSVFTVWIGNLSRRVLMGVNSIDHASGTATVSISTD